MKQVLLFSAVLLVGLFCSCDLCAQACQPNPACKAVCTSAAVKSDATTNAQPVLTASTQAPQQGAYAKTASLQTNGKAGASQSKACNPANCKPANCNPANSDPSKCDPTKCDLTKCPPANCSGAAKGEKIRI